MYVIKLKKADHTISLRKVNHSITLQQVGRRGPPGPGGQVNSVVAGTGITVNSGDPINPVVSLNSASQSSLANADTALQPGDNVSELVNDAGYLTNADVGDFVEKDTLVINVKDHGALGNGTTDDTAAIQDAIDLASAGDIVFIPPGTYIVDPAVSLHLTAGITFAGAGRLSILKIKDNSDVLNNLVKVENADRVILRDFSIDGNRANQDPSDLVAVHYGVYIASSNDCRVDNVYVYNTTGVGIHVYDSVGTVVSNCESSGNRYHGFECEQDTSTIWKGNRGHSNSRHGIFVSPGEVGGTGSIGNIIDGNSFDNNESYGIAFGIDAAGLSIGLTKDNVVTNNSVINNTEYGISIYRVDDTLISNNVVAYNGFFGIYLYRAERNQVIGNRLRNNSQVTNGAYDEILLEGANDGQASQHNLIANNFIYIDGVNKANYAIREGTASDGPNVVKDNYVPNSGVTGRVLIQNVNTAYVLISDTPVENLSSLRTYEDGVAIAPNSALPGSSMGLDAPFGTAALRFINNNTGGNIQFVAPDGNLDVYAGGNNIASFTNNTLFVNSAGGDGIRLNGTGSNSTLLRFLDDNTERGAIFSLNGSSVLNFRSQGDLSLIARNGSSPRSMTINDTTVTLSTGLDLEVASSSNGVILRSPNNTRWRVQVDDTGTLTVTSI